MSENSLENNHKAKETGINPEFIIQKGVNPAILILVSKSKVNTLNGQKLITKNDRLRFMQGLLALEEVKVGENNYSNIGYADFQLKLLGFDPYIYTQFLLESLKINKRTLELLSNEFLGTKMLMIYGQLTLFLKIHKLPTR